MINLPFKRISLALTVAALMAGCSSGVKLEDVPVENKGATSTAPDGANSSGNSQSGVAPVDLNQSARDAAGPVGVARIVYFDFDSYVVKPEYQSLIEQHARFIKASQGRKVMIEGHTDDRGGREYNLALGQKRAEAVRRALGLLGVPEAQMEAVSFGKEKPAVQGNTEDAFSQNRRVELSYR
ncbi:peptidoglycan-associated lipoprotein Pal [Paracidovorax citrulli]|uniref:Peptidoglycan-associated lipoprotein n=2 Tax=Paracidovorax citrulli TaxID=80869 RepID=A1TSM4_PARC0|nr:peptidoglycan-associated lipoprotein Pal [Paracidovorax citrulli]ABM33962.1 OmpA domain protein [Paracidovorax citrulli AAC00-1]ATG94522.1 peptidoglycan-associated lipoprotein [Paracidovorax citrulli]MVT28449.1 peptidoglycan-associated lipoprotein Pal [Paracidovorax citrulli]PVY63399.1 peptidoglycan-associated lipoprotein [Paracidovorax citrulli]QCX12318.1 Peptidoglycan-associated lipoprotein [Paracidovorax citrulli]